MADEFVIRLLSDDFAAGASGGGGGREVARGGAFSLGAKLGVGLSLATEALGILKETVGNVFRPVKNLLKGIFKIVGELLRPISDVLVLVLRPILVIIRPLIQLFKSFMAPFIKISREFGRIAVQQAQKGNIGLALQASIEGVKTLLSPFIISITSIALQLATSLIVASITSVINSVVSAIGFLFQPIADLFGVGDQFKDRILAITTFVDSQGALLTSNLNSAITDGTTNILELLENGAADSLQLFKDRTTIVEGILGQSLTLMSTDMETSFGSAGSIPSAYASGLDVMSTETDSFVGRLRSAAESINSITVRGNRGGGIGGIGSRIVSAGRSIIGRFNEARRNLPGAVTSV